MPKAVITVKKHLNGSVTFWFKDKPLKAAALQRKPEMPTKIKEKSAKRHFKPPKPKVDHPWKNVPPGYFSPKQYYLAKQKLNEIQQDNLTHGHIK